MESRPRGSPVGSLLTRSAWELSGWVLGGHPAAPPSSVFLCTVLTATLGAWLDVPRGLPAPRSETEDTLFPPKALQ